MSVAEIKNAVAAMTEQEQSELAAWLVELLPAPGMIGEPDEGIQEALCRRAELDAGRVALQAAEFWSDVDGERAKWK